MKVKIFSILLITALFSSYTTAQTPTHQQAHRKAHAALANSKSKIDKSVINKMIENEVAIREAEGLNLENEILINDLLKEAKSHIGKKYVHGAKGPKAFDCSGFSSYVYKQFGYSLSPSSRTQYTQGISVDKKDLRKGDLVFFTSRSSGKNVGHVGIVWEVNKETGAFRFIHASIKGVTISDYDGYYVNRYIGAKRIIE